MVVAPGFITSLFPNRRAPTLDPKVDTNTLSHPHELLARRLLLVVCPACLFSFYASATHNGILTANSFFLYHLTHSCPFNERDRSRTNLTDGHYGCIHQELPPCPKLCLTLPSTGKEGSGHLSCPSTSPRMGAVVLSKSSAPHETSRLLVGLLHPPNRHNRISGPRP